MAWLFRIFCTVSSMSLALWVYFIKKNKSIVDLLSFCHLPVPEKQTILNNTFFSALAVFLLLLLLALVCLILSKLKSSEDEIKSTNLKSIEPAGEETMLTYLGLFFYALSVPSIVTLVVTFTLICVECYCTQRYAFNPFYIFFGYRYYNICTGKKNILLISSGEFIFNDDLEFKKLIKINEFTYLDLEK